MEVPAYVTAVVVAVTVAVVVAITTVLRRARKRTGARTIVPEAVGVVLLVWLATTAALAAAGVYRPASAAAFPVVPILFLVGLGGAWIAATTIPSLRALLDEPAVQPSLIALQAWRILGITFEFLMLALGKLPPLFALPAGLGDITAGLAAPFVARRLHQPGGRIWALAWNAFGLLDLVVAMGLGATAAPGPIQVFHTDPSTAVLTGFPMALFPTFLVPLSMLLHILSLRSLLGARPAPASVLNVAPTHVEAGR